MRAFALAAIAATTYAVKIQKDGHCEGGECCDWEWDCPLQTAAQQLIDRIDRLGDGPADGVLTEDEMQGTLEVVGALAHEDPAELTEEDLEYIGEYLGDVAGEDEQIDKRELAEELYWGLEWAGAVDDFFIGSAILDELDRDGNGAADLDEVAAVRDEVEGFVTTFGGEDGVQEDELWDFVDGYYMTLDIRGTDWENDFERAVTSDEVRAVGDELQRAFGEAADKVDALGDGVITEADIWEGVGAFYMLDVNEDGQVTTDDLDELEAGAAEFLGAYDNDGNGELNYIELYAATLHEAADRWEDDWEDDWEEGDWEEGEWDCEDCAGKGDW